MCPSHHLIFYPMLLIYKLIFLLLHIEITLMLFLWMQKHKIGFQKTNLKFMLFHAQD